MSMRRRLALAALLVAAVGGTAAAGYPVRQYYSSWQRHPTHNYAYRTYYYKPHDEYAGYKHQYVVYTPKDPNHYYFYNPYKKQYWGRCPSQHGGKPVYSLLAEKDRRPTLGEIPPTAFPKPAPVPSIPDSTDKVPLDLPPDEPPGGAGGTGGAAGDLPPGGTAGAATGAPAAPGTPAVPANPVTPPAAPAAAALAAPAAPQ